MFISLCDLFFDKHVARYANDVIKGFLNPQIKMTSQLPDKEASEENEEDEAHDYIIYSTSDDLKTPWNFARSPLHPRMHEWQNQNVSPSFSEGHEIAKAKCNLQNQDAGIF